MSYTGKGRRLDRLSCVHDVMMVVITKQETRMVVMIMTKVMVKKGKVVDKTEEIVVM